MQPEHILKKNCFDLLTPNNLCKYDKILGDVLKKERNSKGIHTSSMPTFDFSILYTTLPVNLIKENVELIGYLFKRDVFLYLACNKKRVFYPQTTKSI